ncbi:MAG: redoxin family protein, partial [Rhodospirillaceae bacterium]|nr:redoxin family protein [Rhodospirillaceae bacterium]
SVNGAFVLGAWGHDQGVGNKIRMIGDGSAEFSKATGLELDLSARGLGLRCQRFAMVVDDGKVTSIDIEPAGEFGISSAESQLGKL